MNLAVDISTFAQFNNVLELLRNSSYVMVMPVEANEVVFDELITNRIFITKANEAKKRYEANPTSFTNLTKKYIYLIKKQ